MRAAPTRPPHILIIDDLYGREVIGEQNIDRTAFCIQLRLDDVTAERQAGVTITDPIAKAIFCRGQIPARAHVGDLVENDLPGTLRVIESGWNERPPGTPPWALVLLDLRFRSGLVTADSERTAGPGVPEGRPEDNAASMLFGLRLLEEIQRRYPQLPVVVLSDAPRQSVSRQSMSLGALAFLAKGDPTAPEKLVEYLRQHGLVPDAAGEIVGTSIGLLVALRNARRAASGSDSLLIRGETGTGKELLARFIHRNDPRRHSGPLIVVDSGTLSPELYASELFGHVRGAFTTAVADRPGRIVEAHRGILFLDEIGNVDVVVQRGLLRVLQEKQVRAVGGSRARDVDVRFVFATNDDIESHAAAEDGFRLDLLERIRQGGTFVLPPLRDRLDDLPSLVKAAIREAEELIHGAVHRTIDDDVLDVIARQPWPGNIRQLRSCILSAVRAHPDVEHLVPIHLDLPDAGHGKRESSRSHHSVVTGLGLTAAIGVLEQLEPSRLPSTELVGRYKELEAAFARAAMRYLRACVDVMRKPSVKNPDGSVLIQPAVKLMLGDSKLSASQAYDFVIRLRNLSAAVAQEWDADLVLRTLFERARLQRRTGRRASAVESADLENAHA